MALAGGEGFIKITGEVGTGKSSVAACSRPCPGRLGLPAQSLPGAAHLLLALGEVGLISIRRPTTTISWGINRKLLEYAAADRQVVVCIDEAKPCRGKLFEALRLLSNLETEKRKLLQIVLFGQPELDERLARPGRASTPPTHRLPPPLCRVWGRRDRQLPGAPPAGCGLSGRRTLRVGCQPRPLSRRQPGTPRLVNILANKALLAVFGEGRQTVKTRHVRLGRDTEGAHDPGWW